MNRPDILDKVQLVFILGGLQPRENGVGISVLRKMRYMQDNWGYQPVLLITGYNPLLWLTKKQYETGTNETPSMLNPGSVIIGMTEWLCDAYPMRAGIPAVTYERCKPIPGATYEESAPNVYKVYTNGRHTETQYFKYPGGRLLMLERFDGNGTLLNTTWFDEIGQMVCMTVWDAKNPAYYPMEFYFSPEKKSVCK